MNITKDLLKSTGNISELTADLVAGFATNATEDQLLEAQVTSESILALGKEVGVPSTNVKEDDAESLSNYLEKIKTALDKQDSSEAKPNSNSKWEPGMIKMDGDKALYKPVYGDIREVQIAAKANRPKEFEVELRVSKTDGKNYTTPNNSNGETKNFFVEGTVYELGKKYPVEIWISRNLETKQRELNEKAREKAVKQNTLKSFQPVKTIQQTLDHDTAYYTAKAVRRIAGQTTYTVNKVGGGTVEVIDYLDNPMDINGATLQVSSGTTFLKEEKRYDKHTDEGLSLIHDKERVEHSTMAEAKAKAYLAGAMIEKMGDANDARIEKLFERLAAAQAAQNGQMVQYYESQINGIMNVNVSNQLGSGEPQEKEVEVLETK